MTDHRAIEQQLQRYQPMTFGQQWGYHAFHDMKRMAQPDYWLTVRRRFQPGDTIRIVRLDPETREPAALAEFVVVRIDEEKGVFLKRFLGPIEFADSATAGVLKRSRAA